MKKAAALICALALSFSLFACKGEKDKQSPSQSTGVAQTENTSVSANTDEVELTSNSDASDVVETEKTVLEETFEPKDIKFNEDFIILVSGKTGGSNFDFDTFESLEDTSSPLEEAVYRKISAVEELYGINIVAEEDMGDGNRAMAKLSAAYLSGESEYDAAIVAAYDAVPAATNGYLYELSNVPGIDLSKSWWDQKANSDLSIHGCVFYTTGDIMFWDDMQQNVMGFNKQVKEELGIEDNFYELMLNGEWTHEALATYAKLATEDLDANSAMDMSDKFGIITWDDSVYAIFGGSGEKVVTVDGDGEMHLTLTGTERIINVLSSYTDICFGGDAINYQRYTANEAISMFSTDRALFFCGRLQSLGNFRQMDTDYGILPYPKYDAAQESYYTVASPWHMTFVSVPVYVTDAEKTGAVLEALAYYGKEITTPAYYDTTLTGQYFRDEESIATLELMAATRSYDLGFYVQPANINKELIFMFRDGNKNFTSKFDSYKAAAEVALDKLDATYRTAAEEWK